MKEVKELAKLIYKGRAYQTKETSGTKGSMISMVASVARDE